MWQKQKSCNKNFWFALQHLYTRLNDIQTYVISELSSSKLLYKAFYCHSYLLFFIFLKTKGSWLYTFSVHWKVVYLYSIKLYFSLNWWSRAVGTGIDKSSYMQNSTPGANEVFQKMSQWISRLGRMSDKGFQRLSTKQNSSRKTFLPFTSRNTRLSFHTVWINMIFFVWCLSNILTARSESLTAMLTDSLASS